MKEELPVFKIFNDAYNLFKNNNIILLPFIFSGFINLLKDYLTAIYVKSTGLMHFSGMNAPLMFIFIPLMFFGTFIVSLIAMLLIYFMEIIGFRTIYLVTMKKGIDFRKAANYVFTRFFNFLFAGIIAIILIAIIITIPLAYLMLVGLIIDDLDVVEALNRAGRVIIQNIGTFIIITILVIIIYIAARIIPFIGSFLTEIAIGYIGTIFILSYLWYKENYFVKK